MPVPKTKHRRKTKAELGIKIDSEETDDELLEYLELEEMEEEFDL